MIDKNNIDFKKLEERVYFNNPIISHEGAKKIANRIIQRCPLELEKNVREWSEGKPISDIYIGNLSVNKLLEIWDNPYAFPTAITAIALYKETGCLFEDDVIRYGAPWYDSDIKPFK